MPNKNNRRRGVPTGRAQVWARVTLAARLEGFPASPTAGVIRVDRVAAFHGDGGGGGVVTLLDGTEIFVVESFATLSQLIHGPSDVLRQVVVNATKGDDEVPAGAAVAEG